MSQTIRERAMLVFALAGGLLWLARRQNHDYRRLRDQQARLHEELMRESRENSRQAQALMWLYRQLEFNAPLPPLRGYAISPDFAVLLVDLLRDAEPRNVLEFGSGASTLIVAKTLNQIGEGGHVVAIESGLPFAESVRQQLINHQLAEAAAVVHAPLTTVRTGRGRWHWYDPRTFHFVKEIDFLIVDGPNQHDSSRRMVRYPALPMLKDRLSANAIIVVDDAKREDEQRMVERWLKENPDFKLLARYDELEKGAVVLKRDL